MPLVQADSSSIEGVLVGYFMGDRQFIRLAKQSLHGYAVCKHMGWEFTPENVERAKTEQKDLYDKFKTVNYLSAYGGTPYMMWMNNPEIFPTLASAQAAQEGFFAVFPGVRKFQEDVRARAKREGYLENPWGGRHYFYEVQTWQYDDEGNLVRDEYTGKPKVKLGADSKRVVAFLPQSSAGMFMRDNLRIIGASEWAPYMPANLTVHDSVLLDVPWQLVDRAAEYLAQVLTRPVPQLGGLRIGCEVEVGQNWLDMEKIASYPMLDDESELPLAA